MTEVEINQRVNENKRPAVSIGMPVYNGEKYIREAFDTLLSQSHTDFELIISNNASSDGTEAICQQYASKDSRIRYVRQSINIGALANFEVVLEKAQGDCFMWAAADDKWDPSWISQMLKTMKTTGSEAAFGLIHAINENSKVVDHYMNNETFEYSGPRWFRQLKYFLQFEGVGKANPIYGLWKTAHLREIKLNNYSYDYLIVFDLLGKTEIAGCSESTFYKRIHDDCAGGGVPLAVNKTLYDMILRFWKYLISPMPDGLVSEYVRLAARNKALLVATIPFKYLMAYWFMISNSRIFR
jgi:glycosyltransferase involved in cell wall biosynthesis